MVESLLDPRQTPLLEIRQLSKTFPGTAALSSFDIAINPGEVHALVGHNGSGKSTFIKCLSGYHDPDPGAKARVAGAEVPFRKLSDAGHVSFIHQDLGLVLEMSALDNLALLGGYHRRGLGNVDWRRHERDVGEMFDSFELAIDMHAPLALATPVERTIVALAAALKDWDRPDRVLALDEPTAVLPSTEVSRLIAIIRRLRHEGAGVIYVSHRLDEVFGLADRVTVLRDGRKVGTFLVKDIDEHRLVEAMLGQAVEFAGPFGDAPSASAEVALRVDGLSGRYLRNVSFELRRGEIVGVAGLPTSGRDELPRLLSDQRREAVAGEVSTGGPANDGPRPLRDWDAGNVAIVPPDRLREALILPMSILENLSLAALNTVSRAGITSKSRESQFGERWKRTLGLVAGSMDAPIPTLSGGNQQKVVIGRAMSSRPALLILCEPTAGVDIGARISIHALVRDAAKSGMAVLVTSNDPDDLVSLCTRVIVLDRGAIVESLTGDRVGKAEILLASEGTRGEDDE